MPVENECGRMVGWACPFSRASVWGGQTAMCVDKNPNQAEAGARGEEVMLYLP